MERARRQPKPPTRLRKKSGRREMGSAMKGNANNRDIINIQCVMIMTGNRIAMEVHR
jgi:hypothetical protein